MRERSYLLTVVLLAAAMFAGLWTLMRHEQAAAIAAAQSTEAAAVGDGPPEARPVARVAPQLRDLKLVTVEVRTRVESSRVDESWRGDVRASVAAPARLLYGCDLTEIIDDASGSRIGLRPNLLTRGYVLRVPRPVRLAAEVDGTVENADVEVGWGRFRDLAGEYQLGLARSGLYERARAIRLTPAQQQLVEQTTREQLVSLVRAFAAGGDEVSVEIEFVDAPSSEAATNLATAPGEAPSTETGAGGSGQ